MNRLKSLMNMIILSTVVPFGLCTCVSMFIIEKVETANKKEMENVFNHVPIIWFQYSGTNLIYDLQMPVLAAIFPMIILYILYYMGEKFHSNFLGLSDAAYQAKWYQCPRNVRRFLQLMMMRSQQKFYFSAYGILPCTLEKFVGVS